MALSAVVAMAAARQPPPPAAAPAPSPTAAPPAPGIIVAPPAPTESFDQFLAGVRDDARARGISTQTIDLTLGHLQADPAVISRDRSQPEIIESLDAYIAKRLTPRLIQAGRDAAAANRALLAKVAAAYGVPGGVMTAVWGLESNFGTTTGSFPTIQSLATLAYDARRPIFRAELLAALQIVDRGDIAPDAMKGSWAGAMGQPQFMPSSFLKHAVDFDGDGRVDIWSSPADVLGSMANFLQSSGWTRGERWGREVHVTARTMARVAKDVPLRPDGCRALRQMTIERPLSYWRKVGVAPKGSASTGAMMASLVSGDTRHFLVYRNYQAIVDYNCSNSYAITIGLLADRIAAAH